MGTYAVQGSRGIREGIVTSGPQRVRTTLGIGGLGGLAFLLAGAVDAGCEIWPWMVFGIIWCLTAVYAFLLARWSGSRLPAVLFPLLVLGGIGARLPIAGATFALALGVLSWIRSGICYLRATRQALWREMLLCGGGGVVLISWNPSTPLAWALGIWLFSLVQSLFFVLFEPEEHPWDAPPPDPFERARQRIETLLGG